MYRALILNRAFFSFDSQCCWTPGAFVVRVPQQWVQHLFTTNVYCCCRPVAVSLWWSNVARRQALPHNTVYCCCRPGAVAGGVPQQWDTLFLTTMCIAVADLELLRVECRSNETRSTLQHCVLLLQTWSCCGWSTAAMRHALPYKIVYCCCRPRAVAGGVPQQWEQFFHTTLCIAVADLELLRVDYSSNEYSTSNVYCCCRPGAVAGGVPQQWEQHGCQRPAGVEGDGGGQDLPGGEVHHHRLPRVLLGRAADRQQ